jgi:hypothetical protein
MACIVYMPCRNAGKELELAVGQVRRRNNGNDRLQAVRRYVTASHREAAPNPEGWLRRHATASWTYLLRMIE